jgi:hypothetical protein
MSKEEMINEEALSKAIDQLIEEEFGKAEFDELPKEVDVKANGGTDYIKAEDSEEDEEEEEEGQGDEIEGQKEMDEDRTLKAKKSMPAKNCDMAKKSDTSFDFAKSQEAFMKSFEVFQKSINDKFENVGEIFKGLKYEVDQLKKSSQPRKSISSVDQIKKSFTDTREGEAKEATFEKSEVDSAIESLVKAGQIPVAIGTEFEMYNQISHPGYRKVIAEQILKERK